MESLVMRLSSARRMVVVEGGRYEKLVEAAALACISNLQMPNIKHHLTRVDTPSVGGARVVKTGPIADRKGEEEEGRGSLNRC